MDIPQVLYDVAYNGYIRRLTLIEQRGHFFDFKEESMTEPGYDEDGNFVIREKVKESPYKLITSISDENLKKFLKEGNLMLNYDDAKKKSQEAQDEHYPKGRVWQIQRYWDDMPDGIMYDNLTYKEAQEKIKTIKRPDYGSLYSYDIRKKTP